MIGARFWAWLLGGPDTRTMSSSSLRIAYFTNPAQMARMVDSGMTPVPAARWVTAKAIIAAGVKLGIADPHVAPADDGVVHLEWRRPDRIFVIEIGDTLVWSTYEGWSADNIAAAIERLKAFWQ